MSFTEKEQFLSSVDLTQVKFFAKICDFGLSTIYKGQRQMSYDGTPLYSSPQLLEQKDYSYKVDIWALGIICYELLVGKTPFHSKSREELLKKLNNGNYWLKTKD